MVGSVCTQQLLNACVKKQETYCCFKSILARIIQEQGRPQIGRSWGTPESPDCEGLRVAEVQAMDFSRMDFSEFYAEIKTKMPDKTAIKSSNQTKVSNCYYGGGQCQ